ASEATNVATNNQDGANLSDDTTEGRQKDRHETAPTHREQGDDRAWLRGAIDCERITVGCPKGLGEPMGECDHDRQSQDGLSNYQGRGREQKAKRSQGP